MMDSDDQLDDNFFSLLKTKNEVKQTVPNIGDK